MTQATSQLRLVEHDLLRKPVSTPDQVRGRLFRDHALERAQERLHQSPRHIKRRQIPGRIEQPEPE
jgi:hypothetical protein